MMYTINSDTRENYYSGMCEMANCYSIEAMSAIDAAIKASKNADDDEEVICVDDEDSGITVYAYRDDDSYEFHVYNNGDDHAFTI